MSAENKPRLARDIDVLPLWHVRRTREYWNNNFPRPTPPEENLVSSPRSKHLQISGDDRGLGIGQVMAWSNLEKGSEPSPPWTSRLMVLRTKKAIAAFIVLGCVLVVAIVLGIVGIVHAGRSSEGTESQKQFAGTPSATPTISQETSTRVTALSILVPETSSPVPTSTFSSRASISSKLAAPSATSSSNIPLRIMALGASIVKGETSPGYLGFRKPMRDELVESGFTVNMVGSVRLGDFVDNDVEAYGGKKVQEMHQYAKKIVPRTLPNLFVINLGTNNLLQNKDVDKVGQQMEAMINYLLSASNQSTVILSTMLTNKVPNLEPKVLDMNQQYRDIMKNFEAEGKPVILAEMHPSEGISGVPTVNEIGPDGSHPTVAGYEIMSHIFVQAIRSAAEKGFLRDPVDNGIPADGEAERAGSAGS
ncbi:hypothetical protein AAE478_007003 [Parahypoxylon ruwenzoriense]